LKTAIRSDDPVVYMEHKDLWGLQGEVPEGEHLVPFGSARVVRAGTDVTIVSWSKTVHTASEAATELATRGIDAEVIDLRTLWPWDEETVFASVAKTGRLLVAHEAVGVSGFGAEIVASVCEQHYGALRAPPRRLTAPRVPIAYAPPLEDDVRVTTTRIVEACKQLVSKIQPQNQTKGPLAGRGDTTPGMEEVESRLEQRSRGAGEKISG
jgi:pyruvate dehydrogenase E1 component beta subunit